MSREARRTVKGFDWPLKEVWWGYTLPALACQSCEAGESDNCNVCEGEGRVYPKFDPPSYPVDECPEWVKGNDRYGWQMWETTSEGSPMSPVMDTPEELAQWLYETGASAFGGMTASKEAWLRTIMRGWAVSATMSAAGFKSGVES